MTDNEETPAAAQNPPLTGQFLEVTRPETSEFLWLTVLDDTTQHFWVYDFDTRAFHLNPGLRVDHLIDQDLDYRHVDLTEARRIAFTTYRRIARPVRNQHANDAHAVPGHQVLGAPTPPASSTPTRLTDEEIEESIRFADSALAAAGHAVNSPESDADIRAALRGEITYDEAVRRAISSAKETNDDHDGGAE